MRCFEARGNKTIPARNGMIGYHEVGEDSHCGVAPPPCLVVSPQRKLEIPSRRSANQCALRNC